MKKKKWSEKSWWISTLNKCSSLHCSSSKKGEDVILVSSPPILSEDYRYSMHPSSIHPSLLLSLSEASMQLGSLMPALNETHCSALSWPLQLVDTHPTRSIQWRISFNAMEHLRSSPTNCWRKFQRLNFQMGEKDRTVWRKQWSLSRRWTLKERRDKSIRVQIEEFEDVEEERESRRWNKLWLY